MKLSLALALASTSVAATRHEEGPAPPRPAPPRPAEAVVTNVDGTGVRGTIGPRPAPKAPTKSDLEALERAAAKRARKGTTRLAHTDRTRRAAGEDTP
jgi:hypothetical protein